MSNASAKPAPAEAIRAVPAMQGGIQAQPPCAEVRPNMSSRRPVVPDRAAALPVDASHTPPPPDDIYVPPVSDIKAFTFEPRHIAIEILEGRLPPPRFLSQELHQAFLQLPLTALSRADENLRKLIFGVDMKSAVAVSPHGRQHQALLQPDSKQPGSSRFVPAVFRVIGEFPSALHWSAAANQWINSASQEIGTLVGSYQDRLMGMAPRNSEPAHNNRVEHLYWLDKASFAALMKQSTLLTGRNQRDGAQ